MGAAELAASDAARITSKDFADYDPESGGDITKASNDNFVAKLLRRLVPESGMNRYVDKNGNINQDGYQRVKRAMFSAAYQDADLIAKMAESMDDAIKNVSNGLQAAAANIARLNLRMKEGHTYDYPLAKTIAAAVKKYNAIKEGKAEPNVEAYVTENKNAMFERDPDEVVKMVQVLDGYKRSGKKLGTFFNHLARVIDQQGSPEEDATAFNLGDAGKRLTLGEAIDRAKEKTETGGEQDLFGAPKYSISKEEGAALKEQTLDSLTKDVNNAFKGVGDIRHVEKENGVHEFSFRFQNGTEAKIQAGANITLTDAQAKKARKDHGFAPQSRIIVNGVAATRTGMASITLARFTNAVGTIYHEAFHIAYDLFLTKKEKGVIERAYKDFAKAKGQDVVEYAADRYRDWIVGKLTGKPVHSYAKLWQKIHDGAEMTEQVMRDAEAAAQIFHDIDNGEIWQRPLDTTTRAKEAHARAVADIKREILRAFPGAKNIVDAGDRMTFTMPNGAKVEIRLKESMHISPGRAAQERKARGYAEDVIIAVNGSEITLGGKAFIELSKVGKKGTIYHEALHAAIDLCLTKKQKDALYKRYGGDEERMADAYRDYMLGKTHDMGKLWTLVHKIAKNIGDAVFALREGLDAARTAREAFEQLSTGEAWGAPAPRKRSHGFSLFSRAEAAENPIDNGTAQGDNETKVTRAFNDIPHRALAMAKDIVSNPRFASRISSRDDVDTIADKIVAPMKEAAEQQLNKYRTETTEEGRKARLNMAAYFIGLVDETRSDFNAGGQIYRAAIQSRAVRQSATEGSALRKSIQARSAQIAQGARDGRTIGVKTAGAVDGFSKAASPLVDAIRQQDRGDGVKFSVSTEQESRSDSQDGFSDAEKTPSDEETAVRGRSFVKAAADKLGKALHLKSDKIMLEEDSKDPTKDINLKQAFLQSPSRVAAKVPVFRALYTMACRAMDKNVGLRNDFNRKFDGALAGLKKAEREELFDTLLKGDAEGKEWTRDDLIADGASEAVADAYIKIRRQLNKAYHLVDKARRKPEPKSKTVTEDELKFLRENKFVSDLHVTDKGEDKNGKHRYLVSYMESRNYKNEHREISAADLANFRNDPGIEVVSVEEAKTKSGNAITGADGQPLYNVITAEGPAPLSKLTGYIPHFFHEYMIRVVDKDGNARVIGSARNQREAVQKGEAWLKENDLADGESIHVAPKVFDINQVLGVSDADYAPVMGDRDFYRVQQNLAKQNDMTLAEAKDLLDGAVRLKGRHRFFGNAMHRTGAQGYETDLNWALRHYFNSAARYVAMETEFKPKAISYFERMFGAFDKEYSGLAKYCKDYINDINGNPSALEEALNKALNSTWLFKKVIIPTFGDRAALTLGNGIANKVSYLTLGLNMSSALLNFTQLTNAAAYIGDVSSLVTMVNRGRHHKYSRRDLRILHETGVFNDIGLDSGSGYDQMRGGAPSIGTGKFARALSTANRVMDFAGQKSMTFFREADAICRRGTVLAAYEKARKQGKTHAEAIAFAKEVNYKANFQYGVQDAPNVFRRGSIISQLLLQFKKYGFKELEVMSDFSPWSKTTSRKQKVMFWAMYAMLCGAMGIPALDWLDEIFGEKTGFYLKDEIQKLVISNVGNKRIAAAILYGAPALANMNISNRAGLSDVIPTSLGNLFAGPAASKLVRFAQDFGGGNWANALRDVSPGLYNLYAGYSGEARGKRGRLNDRYDTAWDRILRAVGYKSVEESVPVDMQRIISRDKAARTKEKQAAQDAYIENPTSENKARLKELGVNPKTVTKEAQKKQQTREERMESTVPKKDAERYKTYVDWAKGW